MHVLPRRGCGRQMSALLTQLFIFFRERGSDLAMWHSQRQNSGRAPGRNGPNSVETLILMYWAFLLLPSAKLPAPETLMNPYSNSATFLNHLYYRFVITETVSVFKIFI